MGRYDDINMSDDELAMLGGPEASGGQDDNQDEKNVAAPAPQPAAQPAKVEPAAAEPDEEGEDQGNAADADGAAAGEAEAGQDGDDDQGEAKPAKPAKKNKGGYSVPNWRLAEVAEERDRERREKAALQAELDALKKSSSAKPAEPAFDFDAAEEQVALLLIENNPKEAAKIQKQIREELRKQADAEADARAEAMWTQRESERAAAAEAVAFQHAIKSAYERYPELDHESDDANEEAINAVIKFSQRFAKSGMVGSEALAEAVDTVMSMTKFAKPVPAAKPAPAAAKKPAGPSKEQIQAAVDAAKSQPPATSQAGVGNRAAPVARDFAKMTANEIANLSDADRDKFLSSL